MRKLRKNNKGFTLVEVIVVLVILAILAAIMVPSMTKWIDRAKDKSILVECRSVLLAAQTLSSEAYVTGAPALGDEPVTSANIISLAGIKTGTAAVTDITYVMEGTNNTGAIATIKYTAVDGSKWAYDGTEWARDTGTP